MPLAPRSDRPLPPAPPLAQNAQVWGIVALVAGILSLLVLPIVLAPVAVIAGAVALSMRNQMGWWGILLGGFAVAVVVYHTVATADARRPVGCLRGEEMTTNRAKCFYCGKRLKLKTIGVAR